MVKEMTISKHALELVGVTVEEYLQWCFDNGFPSYKDSSKKEFFSRINECRIVRDKETGRLINKNRKSSTNDKKNESN